MFVIFRYPVFGFICNPAKKKSSVCQGQLKKKRKGKNKKLFVPFKHGKQEMKDPKLINDNCSSVSLCNRNRWWFFAVKATAIQEQEITKKPAKK